MRKILLSSVFGLSFIMGGLNLALAEEPPLPAGLGGGSEEVVKDVPSDEPALPSGLGGGDFDSTMSGNSDDYDNDNDEPALPAGLGLGLEADNADIKGGDKSGNGESWIASLPFDLTGYAEVRAGLRTARQGFEKRATIGEARLQLQAEKNWSNISARVTAALAADQVADRYAIDLDNGDGWIDLREAFISWRATDFMDIKAGRQVLTWGTGDLIFLNDLFPKDFDSFFIGRDVEYLKAPSDAIKTSFFSDIANLDIVYTPNFDSDRFADGARISVFNPFIGDIAGRSNILTTDPRGKWFNEDEWAARLYRNFGAYEAAIYGYDGYWKNPQGLDSANVRATFPRLSVYGASVRGPLYKGIANLEIAYYDSRDDNKGENPNLPNDQFRFLAGYEQELATDLTGGLQYNLERTLDFDNLKHNAPAGSPLPEENRHVLTLRVTKMMMNQNLSLSLFNFWSPNESDGYLRPKVNYKVNDQWTVEAGGNIFYGSSRDTFFGQLEDNTNIYASMRYSF